MKGRLGQNAGDLSGVAVFAIVVVVARVAVAGNIAIAVVAVVLGGPWEESRTGREDEGNKAPKKEEEAVHQLDCQGKERSR